MTLAVTLTVEQLSELVRDSVRAELASRPASPEVFNPEEAAKFLKIHVKTLHRFVEELKIPVHMLGSEKRFIRSELLDFLAQQKKGS